MLVMGPPPPKIPATVQRLPLRVPPGQMPLQETMPDELEASVELEEPEELEEPDSEPPCPPPSWTRRLRQPPIWLTSQDLNPERAFDEASSFIRGSDIDHFADEEIEQDIAGDAAEPTDNHDEKTTDADAENADRPPKRTCRCRLGSFAASPPWHANPVLDSTDDRLLRWARQLWYDSMYLARAQQQHESNMFVMLDALLRERMGN